ncbi:MAG: methyl-accepting chemotaxis protein [Anaerolineaceae bacterium]|nr:methyl-accepting chemotaxis protein [Anaerolineaceae bacterium]
MFDNLKFVWKFTILMVLIPITGLVVALVGIFGANSLKSQYDNLYGFMLIPINSIQTAQGDLKDFQVDILELNGKQGLTSDQRNTLAASAQASEKQMTDILAEYNNQWISTSSADFTAVLAKYGKISLQTDEANALKGYSDGYTAYSALRDSAFSGTGDDLTPVIQAMDKMDTSLDNLIAVNMKFADVSNLEAQDTITQLRWQLILAGVLISLFGIGLSLLLSRSVMTNMKVVSGAMLSLGTGNLNRQIPESVKRHIVGMKDEIGDVGKGLKASESYLVEMVAAAQRIARGDLTIEVEPRSSEDELGMAFKDMVEKLRQMVERIANSANELGDASLQLTNSADQAGQATSQIATTIQQIAKGTGEQAAGVGHVASSIEQMNQAIGQIAQGSKEQSTAVQASAKLIGQISSAVENVTSNAKTGVMESERTAKVAQDGVAKVNATVAGMEVIREKVGLSASKVQEMGKRSDQISQIVETIDDIASQTNLLALNAAIEAARAGEQGKGFAVVADEVRKLAERASAATKEISGIISNIQSTVKEAVVAMEVGSKEVDNGVLRAKESGESLTEILSAAKSVNLQIQTIVGSAKQMNDLSKELVTSSEKVNQITDENTAIANRMEHGANEVVASIESIASVSEENSAAVEEVSASTEEMNAQVEEVSASAQSLTDMAKTLSEVVSEFVLPDAKNTNQTDKLLQAKSNGHKTKVEKKIVNSLN